MFNVSSRMPGASSYLYPIVTILSQPTGRTTCMAVHFNVPVREIRQVQRYQYLPFFNVRSLQCALTQPSSSSANKLIYLNCALHLTRTCALRNVHCILFSSFISAFRWRAFIVKLTFLARAHNLQERLKNKLNWKNLNDFHSICRGLRLHVFHEPKHKINIV